MPHASRDLFAVVVIAAVAVVVAGACSSSPPAPPQPAPEPEPTTPTTPTTDENPTRLDVDASPSDNPPASPSKAARSYAKTTPVGTFQSDLLSALCDPGATCETHVTLPAGTRLLGVPALDDGQPGTASPFLLVGAFEMPPQDTGEIELVVKATNHGATPARIHGMFEYGPDPRRAVAHRVRARP